MKIYLDNAATTKPLDSLKKLFEEHLNDDWYNPSAMYPDAVRIENELKRARDILLNAVRADQMIFTSGGTESANTVIFDGYRKAGGRRLHFITSEYEHPCVYESMKILVEQGHSVTYIAPQADGTIDGDELASMVKEETALISIMHVNNETGAVNDIDSLARKAKEVNKKVLFHADGVQGFLKCPFDMYNSPIDYYSASAHKIHGLKGTGALFYKKGAPLRPYAVGGGQQAGLRSGTENTLGIMAFAQAVEAYQKDWEIIHQHILNLRARLLENLANVDGMLVLSPVSGAPHILNLSFPGMRGEVLLHILEKDGIYISTGSACSSKKGKLSRTHKALGLDQQAAAGAVRISFSRYNTLEEMDLAAEKIIDALKQYRGFIRR